jgi:hypothetical protein
MTGSANQVGPDYDLTWKLATFVPEYLYAKDKPKFF